MASKSQNTAPPTVIGIAVAKDTLHLVGFNAGRLTTKIRAVVTPTACRSSSS